MHFQLFSEQCSDVYDLLQHADAIVALSSGLGAGGSRY